MRGHGDDELVLVEAARDIGTSPVGWIAEQLRIRPAQNGAAEKPAPTEEEISLADARLERCIVTYGHATGADNEQIDADLAREYDHDHSTL